MPNADTPKCEKVLDHGHIKLIRVGGSEIDIVNSARISFDASVKELSEADKKLIGFLMRERHGTPFEAVEFWFDVKAPITVAREWFRHRIASYNEVSGRYRRLTPEFYVPSNDAIRSQVGKPGAYTFTQIKDAAKRRLVKETMRGVYMACNKAYDFLLHLGVAKELARSVLPVGMYTRFVFKTNLRSLLNFVSLRSDETAMWEIQEYSNIIEVWLRSELPTVWEHFEKNGRMAP